MADGSGLSGARYRAFISYSHRDAVFAARLHRRLEGYVLPKRLSAGRRLTPIFKDREELPAAHDLSAQVRAALAASDCLIVACSPDAAASPWVGREIALFRELHPERPILAALIRGEPAEAFPPALAAGGVEPLAADFRKEGDGERLALLKLVAGIAGVGVDQLVQRDAQRRMQGVMAVTAVAVAGMLAMGGMTAVALQARAEAERQRAEAEGLVEFMLNDLRSELKTVGRLPIMTSVNRRALAYYKGQDLDGLSPEALEQRSLLLHAMGEDDLAQGRLNEASAQFDEAYRVTASVLAADRDNPDRLFGHGQSAYWRGYVGYLRKATGVARRNWDEYRSLSASAFAKAPGDLRAQRELAYADGNLCTLALEQERDLDRALSTCLRSLEGMRKAAALRPSDTGLANDVATRWAWLADVQTERGDHAAAWTSRMAQGAILRRLLSADTDNAVLLDNWGVCNRGLALIAFRRGDLTGSLEKLRIARDTFRSLQTRDPTNRRWREQATYAEQAIQKISGEKRP